MLDPRQAESQRTLTVLEEIYQHRDLSAEPAAAESGRRRRPWRGFSWSRAVAPLTVALGAVSLVVGAAQLRHTIRSPALRFAQLAQVGPSLRELAERAMQLPGQPVDTDKDGLPDAQEITLGTSAYLEDTDSDGISDADEVKAGTDPNCPIGQTCAPAATPTPAVSPVLPLPQLDALLPDVAAFANPGLTGNADAGIPLPAEAMPPSPQALRQLLLRRGVPSEALEKVSDAELQQLVAETLQNSNPPGQ